MDAPTTALVFSLIINANFDIKLDINQLIEQFKKSKPLIPADLNINVSDEVKVTDNIYVTVSRAKFSGSLSMVKSTSNPTEKELELIQAARGNRPYNSITDVKISYNEKGSITSIQWTES